MLGDYWYQCREGGMSHRLWEYRSQKDKPKKSCALCVHACAVPNAPVVCHAPAPYWAVGDNLIVNRKEFLAEHCELYEKVEGDDE
jgi:hypothetical protein